VIENQLVRKIRCLISNEFSEFYTEYVIIQERAPSYSPQSKGIAKRKNDTLTKLINALLATVVLSKEWWGEAIMTTCYILNKVSAKNKEITPLRNRRRIDKISLTCELRFARLS
jgi:hypothetical protein